MVCLESLQELIQARKAVRRCAKATNGEFTILHGFFLGMMGVRYRVGSEGGYRTLWPGQSAWLLNNGLVSWDDHKSWGLYKEDIREKTKPTACLVVHHAVDCAHGTRPPLAPFETMTLAYVLNAFVTYDCWWAKPKDIATASFVDQPDMTARQRETFDGLSMGATYDVLDPSQKQDMSVAWYFVARDCQDDEVLVMARLDHDVE
ncbi:hypothetical protein B0T25DRAFT_580040 [Lasiosphaeria hispida]|uniref:Uncharacterized protein n=1 Tax=Lasiosphaeria hispida TaxID=260671 RepID=A0AAJ0HNW4_9PEZI|nr:hypothetical protein B0T25DRAFT_580040 [Lasiosphaeria hispida]